MAIRVLIVDDHTLLREGLAKLLSLEDTFRIIGEASSGQEAIRLTRALVPDVVLMDINMPGMNGMEAAKIIKKEIPRVGIIALTIHEDEHYVFELIKIGVSGYLLKDIRPEQLIQAIKDVAQGGTAFHPTIATKLLGEFRRLSSVKGQSLSHGQLTKREQEVLILIAQGMPNREIAHGLYISEKTVKNHVTNIFRKLEVEDRTQAALYAIKNRIVDF